jgi:hypothetical protein
MSLVLVQGDVGVAIRGVITDSQTGAVANLSGCTVYFQMRKKDDTRYSVNASCTILDAPNGVVRYITGANDLNTAGLYKSQFEVRYPDNSILTTITPVDIEVRRQ